GRGRVAEPGCRARVRRLRALRAGCARARRRRVRGAAMTRAIALTGVIARRPAPVSAIPRALLIPGGLALTLLVLPIVALIARADWASLPAAITSPEALSALTLSLQTATAA